MELLRQLLEHDEGCVYAVYKCSEDIPTLGIGHRITAQDKEFGWPVGAPVDEKRVAELFKKDVAIAISDSKWLVKNFDDIPEAAQVTVASLCFQLGRSRYSKFVKHLAAIEAEDWKEAAAQLRDSRLYKQTTNRTERHAKRLESLA